MSVVHCQANSWGSVCWQRHKSWPRIFWKSSWKKHLKLVRLSVMYFRRLTRVKDMICSCKNNNKNSKPEVQKNGDWPWLVCPHQAPRFLSTQQCTLFGSHLLSPQACTATWIHHQTCTQPLKYITRHVHSHSDTSPDMYTATQIHH